MTPYIAIDIETTGLDPERCQVLEIACVVEDWVTPVEHLPVFRALVNPGEIRGDAYAIAMNAALIREMADAPRNDLNGCIIDLSGFLDRFFPDRHKKGNGVTVAGKNFGAFDYRFLSRSPSWKLIHHRHRFIDAGNLWWNPVTDPGLPDLATCLARAGCPPQKSHSAVHDCLGVIRCVRAKNHTN